MVLMALRLTKRTAVSTFATKPATASGEEQEVAASAHTGARKTPMPRRPTTTGTRAFFATPCPLSPRQDRYGTRRMRSAMRTGDRAVRDVVEARRDLRGLARDAREDRGRRAEQDDEARGAEERHGEDEEDRAREERLLLLLAGRRVDLVDDRDLLPAEREEAEAADEEDDDDPDEPARDPEVDEASGPRSRRGRRSASGTCRRGCEQKARMARMMLIFRCFARAFWRNRPCTSATVASQGTSDVFSTGSQPQ